jgi:hypothetical protein
MQLKEKRETCEARKGLLSSCCTAGHGGRRELRHAVGWFNSLIMPMHSKLRQETAAAAKTPNNDRNNEPSAAPVFLQLQEAKIRGTRRRNHRQFGCETLVGFPGAWAGDNCPIPQIRSRVPSNLTAFRVGCDSHRQARWYLCCQGALAVRR